MVQKPYKNNYTHTPGGLCMKAKWEGKGRGERREPCLKVLSVEMAVAKRKLQTVAHDSEPAYVKSCSSQLGGGDPPYMSTVNTCSCFHCCFQHPPLQPSCFSQALFTPHPPPPPPAFSPHLLKASLQCGVLLDVLPVLIQGGRTNAAQLATS